MERRPEDYVSRMVEVFRDVARVLKPEGTLWLNLGPTFSSGGRKTQSEPSGDVRQPGMRNGLASRAPSVPGIKPKDLIPIPWMVAMALQADGWYLRQAAPWVKRNAMPDNVSDRPSVVVETIFLLARSKTYYYDMDATRRPSVSTGGNSFGKQRHSTDGTMAVARKLPDARHRNNPKGKNRRASDWWFESVGMLLSPEGDILGFDVNTASTKYAHFATFPPKLVEPMVLAGCPENGTILDPFGGSGTTALVAESLGRHAVICEVNAEYGAIAQSRLREERHEPSRPVKRDARAPLPGQASLFPEEDR
jgi:DNA modification methylase